MAGFFYCPHHPSGEQEQCLGNKNKRCGAPPHIKRINVIHNHKITKKQAFVSSN